MHSEISPKFSIASELRRRIRIRSKAFKSPALDPAYMEMALESLPGVDSVRINTRAGCVAVEHDGRPEIRLSILACIRDIPKEAFQGDGGDRYLSSILSVAGRGALWLSTLFLPRRLAALAAWAIGLPVLLDGITTLFTRGVKVQVLDASAVGLCLVRRDYFAATSIVFLLNLGEFLEQLSEDKTTGLLKSLLKPQVEKIWIEVDGQEMEIPIGEARIGDRVVCGSGEMIALDGKVVEGDADVNQSSITGESVPVHVKPGSEVLSGSVVEDGRIVFEASHVGSDTSMARIGRFLENSLRHESESQKKSDELADKLVPVTFGLGLGMLAVTRDLTKAAAVLTVDYSCAIKLANPVAVRVAMYTAARHGVLLKGSQAMDSLAQVDTLVLDKTGTLTRGALKVTDVIVIDGTDENEVLALAAGAEEHYSHPMARAVLEGARQRGIELPPAGQVDFIVAHGVSAYINGARILVGSRHFVEDDEKIDCGKTNELVDSLCDQGKTLLYVASEGRLAGLIALRDELRPEATSVLTALKETGITKIVVLTGDNRLTAQALTRELDPIDEIHWDLKPEEKAAIIKDLQEKGRRIAFAGDGVNDAPALVSADVGISMPGGADLAKKSAQVVLLREDLHCLLAGRLIALRTQSTLRKSFAATVGLNSAFLALASFGLIQPMTAAILHNSNTIGILGYAALAGTRRKGLPGPEDGDRAVLKHSDSSGTALAKENQHRS